MRLQLGRSRWSRAANLVTVSRLVLAPVLFGLILYRNPWWVTFVFALALGWTDYVDGELARQGEPTKFGAFFDPLADKVLALGTGVALVIVGRFWWVPVGLIAVREVGIQVYRVYWARFSLAMPARPLAKYKAVIQGLAILAALAPSLASAPQFADGLLWVAVAVTWFTGAQYLFDGRAALRDSGSR